MQGINDLVTPFLTVFLSEVFGSHDMATWPQASSIRPEALALVEADCFWCLCRLLDGIQDHYTFAQPGIQRLVFRLRELVRRIDGQLPGLPLLFSSGTFQAMPHPGLASGPLLPIAGLAMCLLSAPPWGLSLPLHEA